MEIQTIQEKLKEQGVEATEEEVQELLKVRSLDFLLNEEQDKKKFMKQIKRVEKGTLPKPKHKRKPRATSEEIIANRRSRTQRFQAKRHAMARLYIQMLEAGIVPDEYKYEEE